MKPMSFWNSIVAVFFAAIGVVMIALSRQFPIDFGTGDPGSGFWPVALGTIMIALSVLLFLQSLISPAVKSKMVNLASVPNYKVYMVMGLSVLFCVLVYLAGFLAAALIFIYLVSGIIGDAGHKERILTALIIVAALYIIFTLILKTSLPLPIFLR